MFGTLIVWFLFAVILKVAIGVATAVPAQRNSVSRAFVTTGVLSLGHAVFSAAGPLWLLWPLIWLFILKSAYEIGWGRAVLVWLALMAIGAALVMLVLVPFGLMAGLSAF